MAERDDDAAKASRSSRGGDVAVITAGVALESRLVLGSGSRGSWMLPCLRRSEIVPACFVVGGSKSAFEARYQIRG